MPAAADVVRISSPGDLVVALPHLLGFPPTESVVVMCLHRPRMRVGLTLRLDLDDERHDDAVAAMLATRVDHQRAAAAHVVVVTESTDVRGDLPRRPLVDRLRAAIDVPVVDALLARDGRWWSYVCRDLRCCPSGGTPLDPSAAGATALAAAHALHGRATLPDRASLLRSVAPLQGPVAMSMAQAVDRAADAVAATPAGERVDAIRRLVTDLLDRYGDPRQRVGEDEAALLLLSCHDVRVRDGLLALGADVDRREPLLRLVADVARRGAPPVDAPMCAMWGWLAYADGEGVLAMAAAERALATDPSYSLARLLVRAIEGQLHPREIRRIMRMGGHGRGAESSAG
jgi:hypothetical protein